MHTPYTHTHSTIQMYVCTCKYMNINTCTTHNDTKT